MPKEHSISLQARFDGERWSDQFELLGGNAGIALGALCVGDHELALTAVTPYVERAEATSAGVHWEHRSGVPARLHHISHGTLGIVEALAAVGAELAPTGPRRTRPRRRGGRRESKRGSRGWFSRAAL